VVLPLFAYWYINNIPPQVWASAKGLMPTASRYALLILIFSIVTFALSLLTLIKPKKMHFAFSLVVLAAAFTTMWSFEFIRESLRKPYIIANYMYANSLYKTPMAGDGGFTVEQLNQTGVLKTAKWVQPREITEQNQVAVGREIFRVQCQSCHTVEAYRGIKAALQQRNWDVHTINQMLGSLDAMNNGAMPPFAGTEPEKFALATYLATIHPVTKTPEMTMSGKMTFQSNCAMCHRPDPSDGVYSGLKQMDEETLVAMLEDLPTLNPRMPNLKLTESERAELAKWLLE
jgi:mono/diheme cytochrome c family protein